MDFGQTRKESDVKRGTHLPTADLVPAWSWLQKVGLECLGPSGPFMFDSLGFSRLFAVKAGSWENMFDPWLPQPASISQPLTSLRSAILPRFVCVWGWQLFSGTCFGEPQRVLNLRQKPRLFLKVDSRLIHEDIFYGFGLSHVYYELGEFAD